MEHLVLRLISVLRVNDTAARSSGLTSGVDPALRVHLCPTFNGVKSDPVAEGWQTDICVYALFFFFNLLSSGHVQVLAGRGPLHRHVQEVHRRLPGHLQLRVRGHARGQGQRCHLRRGPRPCVRAAGRRGGPAAEGSAVPPRRGLGPRQRQ